MLGLIVFQDAVFVKLEVSSSVVFEPLGIKEFLLVEHFTEIICLPFLRWVLLHEEEDNGLPDVRLTLLIFCTCLFEDGLVFSPKFENIPIIVVEETANTNIVFMFRGQICHKLRLLQLCQDSLGVGISLSDQLVDVSDGILYYT